MKNFAVLFLLFLTFFAQAKTWTVNNNNPSPGQFSSLQLAIDASLSGDTILVHGSKTTYGAVQVSKGLTFFGTGWNPQKDFPLISQVDNFKLLSGSSNTTIAGFYCASSLLSDGGIVSPITKIVLKRNFCSYYLAQLSDKMSEVIIEQNIGAYLSLGNADNVFINNNIITGYITASNKTSVIIQNNFFTNNGNAFSTISSALITDNIFYRAIPEGCSGSVFNNNLTYNCLRGNFPPASESSSSTANTANNLNIVNTDPQFVNVPTLSIDINTAASYDFRLKSTSPALKKGTNNTDIGITGGKSPMYIDAKSILGADVYTPQIKSMQLNVSSIPQGGSFNVTVKAKKQN